MHSLRRTLRQNTTKASPSKCSQRWCSNGYTAKEFVVSLGRRKKRRQRRRKREGGSTGMAYHDFSLLKCLCRLLKSMRQLRKRNNGRKKPEQSFGQSMMRSWQSGRNMRREGGIETQCWLRSIERQWKHGRQSGWRRRHRNRG